MGAVLSTFLIGDLIFFSTHLVTFLISGEAGGKAGGEAAEDLGMEGWGFGGENMPVSGLEVFTVLLFTCDLKAPALEADRKLLVYTNCQP